MSKSLKPICHLRGRSDDEEKIIIIFGKSESRKKHHHQKVSDHHRIDIFGYAYRMTTFASAAVNKLSASDEDRAIVKDAVSSLVSIKSSMERKNI